MSLFGDNIPVSVYKNLIVTVKNRVSLLHDYVSFRKDVLKLDEFRPYDMYVSLSKHFDYKIEFEEAKEVISNGLLVLGEDYQKELSCAYAQRWIDPYENVGKRAGAYATGSYGTHPYVLMNWQGNMNSLFTLAHELGHAMHFRYTYANQPFMYAETPIFVAEVASTVNEVLLSNHMIKKSKDDLEKAYLLEYFVRTFVGTLFRQTLFAEFEMKMFEMAQAGEALTYEELTILYSSLLKEYYGEDYLVDDQISVEWSRIPHFYRPFYVYQYATGYSAACDIAKRVMRDDAAKDDYIKFLKAGNSNYPIEILKIAGVDMFSSRPIDNALDLFASSLNDLKSQY